MDNRYAPPAEWIENQKKAPSFWKGSYEDVLEAMKNVKRGRVTLGTKSAGGRDVYMVEYGERNELNRTATFNSATCVNGKDTKAYADKTRDGVKPCLMLMGAIHGLEFEGTVSLLNLINLLETGKDFMGNENPLLYEMAEKLHLIIIPMVNPDGRCRFPYKSIVGAPYETFRYYAQGTWKNGELCNHPACKAVHPIKEASDFIGCYFNDDGVNIQQEGVLTLSNEAKFLFETAHEFAPDILINMHGGSDTAGALLDTSLAPQKLRNEIVRLDMNVNNAFVKENFKYVIKPRSNSTDVSFKPQGLTGMLHLCCGGLSMSYESNQGVYVGPGRIDAEVLSYEEIYRTHILLYQEVYKYTLKIFEKRKQGK